MILNLPEIYYLRLLIALLFLILILCFKLSKNIKYMMIAFIWLSGLGTSPFTETDYSLYLEYIKDYENFPAEYIQNFNGLNDLIKIDKLGYYFLYNLNSLFPFDFIFQIFISIIFFISTDIFSRISGLNFNERTPIFLVIPLTSTYIFSTDWYLRQGVGVAIFIMGLSIFFSNYRSNIRYPFFIVLSLFSIIWHLSMLYLLVIFFLSQLILKSNLIYGVIFPKKINNFSYLILLSLITFIFIFPLRYYNIIFELPDFFDTIVTYKSIYENSEWSPQRPGYGFILHFILIGFFTKIFILSTIGIKNYNLKPALILIPILWFIVLFSLFAMSITSLGSRFLLPFSYFLALASLTFTSRYQNFNVFYFILNIFIILLYSLFMVFENGGNSRVY